MNFILHPTDTGAFGGKAGALRALQDAGLPIPPWFAVAPGAFHASHRPDYGLAALEPAPEVAAEVRAALAALEGAGDRFAVRSSAADEDGGEHSFAGQLDSFLFVPPA
jgi:pyruvate,water dikinase